MEALIWKMRYYFGCSKPELRGPKKDAQLVLEAGRCARGASRGPREGGRSPPGAAYNVCAILS
eukprot:15441642-Alexandrium_andersonii.AAC.1